MSDDWPTCETCDGSGTEHVKDDVFHEDGYEAPVLRVCPSCGGLGKVPPEDVVDEWKSIIGSTFIESLGWGESKPFASLEVYAIARIAATKLLLAVAREEQERM